jgi:hypothetical protein
MPFLHGIRDPVIRDKVRTVLQEEPLKDRCSGKRHWAKLEGINGIRSQGARWQLRLSKERATGNGIRG